MTMTAAQRQIRQNVRNFLLTATIPELERELEISKDRGDHFRAQCVQELLDQEIREATEAAYDKLGDGWLP